MGARLVRAWIDSFCRIICNCIQVGMIWFQDDPYVEILNPTGPKYEIKMFYQYSKFHCGDELVIISSYLHNSYTGMIESLFWNSLLISVLDVQAVHVRPIWENIIPSMVKFVYVLNHSCQKIYSLWLFMGWYHNSHLELVFLFLSKGHASPDGWTIQILCNHSNIFWNLVWHLHGGTHQMKQSNHWCSFEHSIETGYDFSGSDGSEC